MDDLQTPPPRRGWPWKRVVLALLLAPVLGGAGLWSLVQATPSHYREHQAFLVSTTADERAQLADGVLTRLEREIRRARERRNGSQEGEHLNALRQLIGTGDGTGESVTGGAADAASGLDELTLAGMPVDVRVRLNVTQAELRSLIAENAEDWVRQQGYRIPKEVSDPMVTFAGGKWVAACTVSVGEYHQVVTGYFDVSFQPGGMARGGMTGFDAGRLPVPLPQIGSYIAEKLGDPERGRQADAAIARLKRFEVQPVVQINGRRITIEDVNPGEDGFDISARVQSGPELASR